MNYPNQKSSLSTFCGEAVERPPTEIECELNEAQSVCNSLTEAISKLESRLSSVTLVPMDKPEPNAQPKPVLTPLAESISRLTEENRENARRIFRLIDTVQVPY